MKQQDFERQHDAFWARFETLLAELNGQQPAVQTKDPMSHGAFPQAYRQVCHHLALARERQYASYLIARLERLVLDGHQHLYRARGMFGAQLLQFVVTDFPVLVRAEARLFWLAAALLYLPALLMGAALQWAPHLIYTLLDHATLVSIESMYDPNVAHIGRARQSDGDFLMFGYYIKNNIGISFQTFSGGLLYGLGSVFYLVYNGLFMGAVAGHLTRIGSGGTFYPFVVGHGAFELTAIVLSGAAGLKLGLALLSPGNQTRLAALRAAAQVSIRLVYGVVGMLLIAAFIEAFWSSSQALSPAVKYSVGGLLWLGVSAYFIYSGRGRAA